MLAISSNPLPTLAVFLASRSDKLILADTTFGGGGLITLIGLVSIVLGSDLTVASAKSIAQVIGVDDRTISVSYTHLDVYKRQAITPKITLSAQQVHLL